MVAYAVCKRSRALYYNLTSMMSIFVVIVCKMIYHSPRPHMVSEEIQIYGCSTEFGDPSGHTLSSSAVLVAFCLDFQDVFKGNPIKHKLLVYIFNALILLLVGYSRLFNGAHSLD